MFGRVKCKLCSEDVRFAFRHLKLKHPAEVSEDVDFRKLNMSKMMEKYFTEKDRSTRQLSNKCGYSINYYTLKFVWQSG